MSIWNRKKKTSGTTNPRIENAAGDPQAIAMLTAESKCTKCGASIIFAPAAFLAQDNGIEDKVVMCKECKAVFEFDLSPSGMSLTSDVTHRYDK